LWDALIIESARIGGCHRVLTEDLQDGGEYDGLVVENPFKGL
jgi:predicted nucleic acid-binding protein